MSLDESSAVNLTERIAFLTAELDRQQLRFARRRRRDKRKAFALQMATVTLSATITVLLGLRVAGTAQQLLTNIALVLGAFVTVLAAMEAFFDHRGLWVGRTVTVRRLEALRRQAEYRLIGGSEDEVTLALLDELLAELDKIIADDQRAWLRLRSAGLQPTEATGDEQGREPRPEGRLKEQDSVSRI
ncbi:DUF4231 domain-containing protein [Kribbella sp. NPDC050820]|uniref:SLATT domain-containing protein n=1 Tax=Kribbella sp. NPDC050820 TaxID=3155408 RepID=UPI0033FC8466